MTYTIERFFPVPDIAKGERAQKGKGEQVESFERQHEAYLAWGLGANKPGLYCLWHDDFMLASGTID